MSNKFPWPKIRDRHRDPFNATQELTVALANVNFDFSLFKCEAPAEYEGVGAALTKHRRNIAENGMQHVTARKLSALFQHILFPIPRLIEAYGKRASEIAKLSRDSSNQSDADGPFADFTGPDATSIWAAATSGNAAVAVHLLACMLARVWTPSEATSIWVELVETRKRDLGNPSEQDLGILLASQCQLTREQLADWDNSARVWLRRADQAKKLQQTQLMLVCNNLDIAVNLKLDVYENVIAGWTTSLRSMEDLLSGLPQRAQDGSLLLALSSWHIYPNMTVLGSSQIAQKDPLVPEVADLILNMESSPSQGSRGVYWCLSLSKLRFYGDPDVREQCLNVESSRLSVEQIAMVALGSVIGGWGPPGLRIVSACNLINLLDQCAYGAEAPIGKFKQPRWLFMLAEGSRSLKRSTESMKEMFMRLIKLGRGAGGSFLAIPKCHPPYLFGLSRVAQFIPLLSNVMNRVMLLMKVAQKFFPKETHQHLIIQYPLKSESESKNPEDFGYITALPSQLGVIYNWTKDESTAMKIGNHPWLPAASKWSVEWHPLPPGFTGFRRNGEFWQYSSTAFLIDTPPNTNPTVNIPVSAAVSDVDDDSVSIDDLSSAPTVNVTDVAEEIENLAATPSQSKDHLTIQDNLRDDKVYSDKYRCLGDVQHAALFMHRNVPFEEKKAYLVRFQEIEESFVNKWVDPTALQEAIDSITYWASTMGFRDYATSLVALGVIEKVYSKLGDATITPSVVRSPLHDAKWLGLGTDHTYREIISPQGLDLNREEVFSCICHLETGLDITPSTFHKVVAMSSGDSIFVSAGLLCDPSEFQHKNSIKRLIGNFGKPGVALLIPPASPLCRVPDAKSWMLLNYDTYNGGRVDNSLHGTTLHLSFTGWVMQINAAMNMKDHGAVDKEIEMYEALVSVHDQGKWVADLDVHGGLSKSSFDINHDFYCKANCDHEKDFINTSSYSCEMNTSDATDLVTIASWDELVDFLNHPKGPALALAQQDWMARLTIVSLAVLKNMRVFVNRGFCWHCFKEICDTWPPSLLEKTLFVC